MNLFNTALPFACLPGSLLLPSIATCSPAPRSRQGPFPALLFVAAGLCRTAARSPSLLTTTAQLLVPSLPRSGHHLAKDRGCSALSRERLCKTLLKTELTFHLLLSFVHSSPCPRSFSGSVLTQSLRKSLVQIVGECFYSAFSLCLPSS